MLQLSDFPNLTIYCTYDYIIIYQTYLQYKFCIQCRYINEKKKITFTYCIILSESLNLLLLIFPSLLIEHIDVLLLIVWSGSASSIISGKNIICWSSGTLDEKSKNDNEHRFTSFESLKRVIIITACGVRILGTIFSYSVRTRSCTEWTRRIRYSICL